MTFRFKTTVALFLAPVLFVGSQCLVNNCSWGQSNSNEVYDPARFEKVTVAPNLIQPMEMAIAPDGQIFLIELGGLLKRIDPEKQTSEVIGKISVTTEQENGLIGIALDPNFEKNSWIYLQYSPPDFVGQHVSRFTIRDGKLDMSSESLVLKYEEQRFECCHHAGSMEFGPDGNLYIGTGDNTNPFGDSQGFAPIDEREKKGAFNAQRTAANTRSHNGKVLRIKPLPEGGYAIPDGNLFPKDGSIGLPEIYVMGCRNPWRLNLDQKTGYLYWGDVGPDAGGDGPRGPKGYDEVNQAKKAGNFGWPLFIANNRPYPRVDFTTGEVGPLNDASKPINSSVFNTGAKELPPAQPAWIYYPGGPSEEFPELGSGGRTACAGPTYYFDDKLKSSTKFPNYFDRTIFIFEWSRNWIKAVHLNPDSSIGKIEAFLPDMKFIRPIDLQFDRKGSLYVIEYGETWGVNADAKLVRLDYVRGNRTPQARAVASATAGKEPLTVSFSSEGSTDKDNDRLSYQWRIARSDVPIQEARVFSLAPNSTYEFTEAGVFNVQLQVTDAANASDYATLAVVVGNAIPNVSFIKPVDGDFFEFGKEIEYKLLVRDVEDGVSDPTIADEEDIEFLDSAAPDRTVVGVKISNSTQSDVANTENDPPGLKLMRGSDCLNCHAMDRPLVGPMFIDIANKYRDQPNAIDASIDRVAKGSQGVWGKVPMLPHSQHTREQIREMVSWVYQAKPVAGTQSIRGMVGASGVVVDKTEGVKRVQMQASYTDRGRDMIPALTGSASITLRSRTVEAEAADEFQRMQVLGSHRAGDGKFLGSIEHDAFMKIANVPLDQVSSIAVRVTSAGAGGDIEIHAGAIDGPVLGTIHVDVNGDWDGWYERSVPIRGDKKRTDVYFRFVNEKNRGGLMNIDSVRFDR